jgi:hypothetical protein
MRIWDLEPSKLCRAHLLGEHRELHGLWNILNKGKKGYRNHQETKRWIGKMGALLLRHEALVEEIKLRGWNHKSPLPICVNSSQQSFTQDELVDDPSRQIEIIKNKGS